MPTLRLFTLFLIMAAIMGMISCRKDALIIDTDVDGPGTVRSYETSAMGVVYDETGQPLGDAKVSLGSASVQTNSQGVFTVKGNAREIQAFVKVEKNGYFPSIVSFSGKAGDTGRVMVTLKEKRLQSNFQSGTGGTVPVEGGGSITFPQDGIKTKTGQPYSGTVRVFAYYIDPSDPGHAERVPGAFRGRTTSGELTLLQSFGMVKVLLETADGQELQLSKEAEISFPIPTDRNSVAPATIPLWYIDEASSLWIQEGQAVRSGDFYVGKVSHFSWWNCDLNVPQVTIEGNVTVNAGSPFLRLNFIFSGWSATTTTTQSGYFQGPIPAGQPFTMEVYDECRNLIHTQTFGPYQQNTNLGIINVTTTSQIAQISGRLLNCANMPVTNGLVSVRNGTKTLFPMSVNPADGTFSGTIVYCDPTNLVFTGFDLDELKASSPVTAAAASNIQLGNIPVCGQDLPMGVTFEYQGQTRFFPILSVRFTNAGGNEIYNFTAVDDQGGGNRIIYQFQMYNLAQPPLTNWQLFNSVWNIDGTPTIYTLAPGAVQALVSGTQSGELVHFEMTNGNLHIDPPMGLEFFGVRAIFTGKIE
jgi:hypothetical protein